MADRLLIVDFGSQVTQLIARRLREAALKDEEGRALIDGLIEHAVQPQFVYTHRWRANELVMWDNRCTMHRGTDYDDLRWVRDMQRVTISYVANSCEQEGVTAAA